MMLVQYFSLHLITYCAGIVLRSVNIFGLELHVGYMAEFFKKPSQGSLVPEHFDVLKDMLDDPAKPEIDI